MSILNPDTVEQVIRHECSGSSYTFKDLQMLASPEEAYLLPLAVIGLIDMNAFFAQCEQVRLGKGLEDPVVCCQWKSLIAVSYAARKYGISRLDPLGLALKKCPQLVVGHAAVFKKGESFWRYIDGLPSQAIHKVSLDPYRRELRKVFRILQSQCDLVEKASVDECYLDLGRLVYSKLMDLFPCLRDLQAGDKLPPVPSTLPDGLKWEGMLYQTDEESAFFKEGVSHDNKQTQSRTNTPPATIVKDWSDICLILGSQYLFSIRCKVYEELKYTTSGGLGTTKTIAKLAAGFVKPDYQTIVSSKAINAFLSNFELTDVTSMGGMIGKDIVRQLQIPPQTNSISFIRQEFTLEQLKEEFPQDHGLATRVFEFCRGIHQQKLKLRTQVKSMMSRKNFLADCPVKTVGDTYDWIKVFVGDLYGRLIELDDESMNLSLLQSGPNERASISRPRTVAVHYTTSAWEKQSKQTKFPVIRDLVKFRSTLELVYFKLLCQILENNKASDCEVKYLELNPDDPHLYQLPIHLLANLSVVIGNFVITTDKNLIDSYGQTNQGETDKDSIKRQFEEVTKRQPNQSEEPKPKRITRSNSYVKKLFADFEKEQGEQAELKREVSSEPEKPKDQFKEDKEYVNRMFMEYQNDVLFHKAMSGFDQVKPAEKKQAKTKSKVQVSKNNESSSASSRSRSPETKDAFWKELMQSQRCPTCNVSVDDVFEHRDYHFALELSSKLNNGTTSRVGQKKKSQNQSTLPF